MVKQSSKSARFDILVEFYDAACKVSGGQVLVDGPPTIEMMQTSSFSIPRSKYDLYEGTTGMAKRLKSISIVNFSYMKNLKMFMFIKTMIFIPILDAEYEMVDEAFEFLLNS